MMEHVIPTLLSILSITNANDLEILILHNSDMHARYEQTTESIGGDFVGGFSRTATIIREARQNASLGTGPPVLFLNAGDTFTGTIWHNVHRWRIAAALVNALAPNATCLGNHEFDDGTDGLIPFVAALECPVVTANIDFGSVTELNEQIKAYHVLEIRGRKIGVIGYLTPETRLMSAVGETTFTDEVDALRTACNELKGMGVNIIIALGHSGYETDKRIASEVECVDVVVGGHTNTFLWNGEPPDKEQPEGPYPTMVESAHIKSKMVPIVHAFAHTKYMGKLRVVFDGKGDLKKCDGAPIFLNKDIPQDPHMLALLENYRAEVNNYYTVVVGKSRSYLDGDTCRYSECNFANALTDAFVDYVSDTHKTEYWSTVSIGLINSGSIRLSVNTSRADHNVTAADLLGAVPFHQTVVTFTISGKYLIESLEVGARSDGETSRGEFLQVSGMKVVYDFARPAGSRVVSAKARCSKCYIPVYEPVKPDEIYYATTTMYLLNGGDGHSVLRDRAEDIVAQSVFDIDCFIRYFNFYKVLTPQEEERVIVYNHPQRTVPLPPGNGAYYHNRPYILLSSIVLLVCISFKHLNL